MEQTHPETEVSQVSDSTGWIRVKKEHFAYTIAGRKASIYGPDETSVQSVSRAARALRRAIPRLNVRVRLVPSVRSVLLEDVDWYDMLDRFNDALRLGLLTLGVQERLIDQLDTGGMPSEYRGFLARVGHHAQGVLSALETAPRSIIEPFEDPNDIRVARRRLADEMVFATRAVAFSMREGYATVPFTIAVALKALEAILRPATDVDEGE